MTDQELAAAPDTFPRESARFALDGPAGKLEVIVDGPEEKRRSGVAVICHPHPQHGGTLRNKVVTIIERSLREVGLDTVRFNFRGVGASEGSYDEGNGESEDLACVVEWVRRVRPDDALWLGGFSFGSYVAIRNAVRLNADALVTVAPPIGRWKFESIELPTVPWLIVQGEEDEVVEADKVFAWLEAIDREPALVRMPETGHYFHRRLMDLRGAIKNGVRSWLPPTRGD